MRSFVCLMGVLSLGACGNFSEQVDIGTWQQVNARAIPRDTLRGLQFSITSPGTGRPVVQGDLVQLRVVRHYAGGHDPLHVRDTLSLWLWTGWEGPYTEWGNEYGVLGDETIRRALIGVPVGTALRVAIDSISPQRHESAVPRYGIQPLNSWSRQTGEAWIMLAEHNVSSRWWSDATVVQACPATLHRRITEISQWGFIVYPSYPTSRHGQLYWSGLFGHCASPTGEIWLPAGMQYGAGMVGGNAYNSLYTMQSKHPASRYPEDYWDPASGAPAVIPRDLGAASPSAGAPTEDRSAERTAGAAHAMDEGLTDSTQCKGTPAFVAGCAWAVQRMQQGS